MRIESDKPLKNGGWLHRQVSGFIPSNEGAKSDINTPTPDFEKLLREWAGRDVEPLAIELGLDSMALEMLGCVWCPWKTGAWAFPMRDAAGQVIGIRLRLADGSKRAIRGSRNGLFIPRVQTCKKDLFVVEGASDTAAAWQLGLRVIGRPSCSGGVDLVKSYIERNKIKRVVIVPDADDPGLRGAEPLSGVVPLCVIFVPPRKDMRECLRDGISQDMIRDSVGNLACRVVGGAA